MSSETLIQTQNQNEQLTERAAEFAEALMLADIETISVVPDIGLADPTVDATRRFIAEQYRPETTLYLVPELSDELAGNVVGFEQIVSSLDSSASGHGVFFGSIYLADGGELQVAVKPHHIGDADANDRRKMERSCLRDYFTNVAAHEAKFDGIKSIGFMLGDDGTPFSLTLLDLSINTLETVEWTKMYKEGHETSGMKADLEKAAILLARVHVTGDSFHGDPAPRNCAGNLDGQMFLIDWELGNITTQSDESGKTRSKMTYYDLSRFMRSLAHPKSLPKEAGVAMFKDCKGSWWDAFKDVFLDSYMDWRLALVADGSHQAKAVRQTKEELEHIQEKLRMDMLMIQDRFDTNQKS